MRKSLVFIIVIAILLTTSFGENATFIHAEEESVIITNIKLYHQSAVVNVKTTDQDYYNQSVNLVVELEDGQCIGNKEFIFDKAVVEVEVDFDKIVEAGKKVYISILTKSGEQVAKQEEVKNKCNYDGFILSDNNTMNDFEIGPSGIVAYFHEFDTVNYTSHHEKNGYLNIQIGPDNYKALVGEDGWCKLKFDKTYMDGLEAECTLYCAGNCQMVREPKKIEKEISEYWKSYNVVTPDLEQNEFHVTTHHASVSYGERYIMNGATLYFEEHGNSMKRYCSDFNNETDKYSNVLVPFGKDGFTEGAKVDFWIENSITGKKGKVYATTAYRAYSVAEEWLYPKIGDKKIYVNHSDDSRVYSNALDKKLHVFVNNKQYDVNLEDGNIPAYIPVQVDELCKGDIIQVWIDDKFGNKSNVVKYNLTCDCKNCKWNVVKQSNCAEAGKKEYVCTVCKEVKETKVIPAQGHEFGKGYVKKKATYTSEGCLAYKCINSECTYEKTEIIPRLEKRSLKKKNIYLDTYDEVDLKKYISGTKKNMKWSVSKKKIVRNEGNGKYTGEFVGKTKVTVRFSDTNQTLSWVIYVNKDTNYDLYVGESKKIKTFTKYSGIKNSKWKSVNSVIKISGGKLLFKKKGKGKIKCKYDGKKFEITFIVKKKAKSTTTDTKKKSFLSYSEIYKKIKNYVKNNWSSEDVLYVDNMVLTVGGVRRYYFHFTHYGTTQHYYLDDNKGDTEIYYDSRY